MNEKKASEYQKKKLTIGTIINLFEIGLLCVIVFFGVNLVLNNLLLYMGIEFKYLRFVLYIIALALLHQVILFPLFYLKGYRLEKSYGLSNQDFNEWLKDHLKGLLIGWIIGILATLPVFYFMNRYPQGWWWRSAIFLWVAYVLLVKFAPRFLFTLFFKFKKLQNEELREKIMDLTEKAGLPITDAYEFDMSKKTKAANAGITGLGSSRRLILADTLLENYSEEEILVVVAHELGHHKHNHMGKIIVLNVILLSFSMYVSQQIVSWGVETLDLPGPGSVAAFPILLLVFAAGSFLFMPAGNSLLRHFERQADRFALKLSRKPEAFISLMKKLAKENLADLHPHPAVEAIFMSHPAPGNRIQAAESFRDHKD